MGGVHSVAYGGHLYLVCDLCDITSWRHIHVSKPTFCEVCWHNMHILLHALSYFMCHCTECKLSALQFRISEENALDATARLVHGNGIPMGIPWETSHGMGWDSTHLYFPWDSEIEWVSECYWIVILRLYFWILKSINFVVLHVSLYI